MRKIISMALSLLIAFSCIITTAPTVFAVSSDGAAQESSSNDNQNNQAGPVEEWNYTPKSQIASYSPRGLTSAGTSSDASSDIVKVHVTAKNRTTSADASIAGAEVGLYVGSKLISTTTTDSSGVAEVSLAGLSIEERQNATVSAKKIVSRGQAIDGDDRDLLFNNFPKDESGDYYRYTLELHSEEIDANGNWCGAEIPTSYESNKIDIVFAIDATGSMSEEINNVKTNIARFSENLIASGLDIRFCIIEYRDMTLSGEDTKVHTLSGSHWLTTIDSVVSALGSITASGGGDTPETVMDALGYVADNSLMKWRSDAYRFAFVLTDANYKTNNNYGYTSMSELTTKLDSMDVVTSVITSTSYQSTYSGLYNGTGGIYANINSSSFSTEMQNLSNSIIESVTREITLTLSEPRMLVNMAVCYFANDSTSQSSAYRESVKNMLNEYANRVAESTDGHVLIDKVLLFYTANRLNFYNTSNIASMADIRIETEVNDAGNVQVHSNAHVTGFFSDGTYTAAYDESAGDTEHFTNLPEGTALDGRTSFYRIQMSGIEGAGWDNSMIDDAYAYSTTVMHETGHYLLGFFDEYLNADGNSWRTVGGKPYPAYGLMDNQHTDIEISKDAIDYAYISGSIASAPKAQQTRQSWNNKMSCESFLAEMLTSNSFQDYFSIVTSSSCDYSIGQYLATYTKATGTSDRHASYSYAGLDNSDFLNLPTSGSAGGGGGGGGSGSWSLRTAPRGDETAVLTQDAVADVDWTSNADTVTISITPKAGTSYSVSILKSGDEDFTPVTLTSSGTADLPIAKGELAEVRVAASSGTTAKYNTYYVDRSEDTSSGYIYSSADNAVMAYVTTSTPSSYTFIADNTNYTNGEYRSVNQATRITSDNGVGFNRGEIYSVASYLAEIDYTTLSWFKYADGKWTKLSTDYSAEETMNIGARADLAGEGLYVLMAKAAPAGSAQAATNLSYTQSSDRDAVVTLSFDDPNTNSKYYNVYYSESSFTDKNAENVVVRSFDADSTDLTINLLERGRTVYAAVEIVLENGSRSPLSSIILIGGEADSDGDGIPDWYCDKYLLWGKDGEDKDIANSDDDGDGLTNLQEYKGGSDPTNPNDPTHTTNIPVTSITVSPTSVTLGIGDTANVTASVAPANATNKAVTWSSADTSIATVTVVDGVCKITAVKSGTTTVYAVTADGGYSASVAVTVADHTHTGGTATCHTKAVCTICNAEYGEFDASNHDGGTEVRNAVEATYTTEGYTGDTYCLGCGEKIANGIVIPKKTDSSGNSYPISVKKTENGTVTANQDTAAEGTIVIVAVDTKDGYTLDKITVTDKDGNEVKLFNQGNGKYIFIMPASQVQVNASFVKGEAPTSLPFTDVKSGDWFYEDVAYVYANNLMNGTSATTFSPKGTTTRGMIVTILYRLENTPAANLSAFADVASNAYYAKAVGWASANGIVNGYSDVKFGPNDPITREQMAAILYRYAQYKGYDVSQKADLSKYQDQAAVSAYAKNAMAWANAKGLITGVTDTSLSPQGSAIRAQVAAILHRFCETVAK
ncbi:MAG: S-layer homology domain-containing protein [Evtepia sp.]